MTRTLFATLDADLAPVEVPAVQCRTFWQRVESPFEAAWSGVAAGDYAPVEVQHAALGDYDSTTLTRYRLFVVEVAEDLAGGALVGLGLAWDGETITADPTYAAQSPEAVAALRGSVEAAVRAEAVRRVALVMDERTQRRTFARGFELILTLGLPVSDWPVESQAEAAAALAAWAQISAIETAETAILAALPDDAAGLAAFDVAAAGWP